MHPAPESAESAAGGLLLQHSRQRIMRRDPREAQQAPWTQIVRVGAKYERVTAVGRGEGRRCSIERPDVTSQQLRRKRELGPMALLVNLVTGTGACWLIAKLRSKPPVDTGTDDRE